MSTQLKQTLRDVYIPMRRNVPPAMQQAASKQVCNQIVMLKQYQDARKIALYNAMKGEIDLKTLWQSATSQDKHYYFPALNNHHTISFLPVTQNTPWCKKDVGILEPDVDPALAIAPEQLDVIFLPLVAFDEHGTRIGMGGGHYDRTLANQHSSLLIGVAYEFQRLAYIHPSTWDVPLTAIITQQTIYWSKP